MTNKQWIYGLLCTNLEQKRHLLYKLQSWFPTADDFRVCWLSENDVKWPVEVPKPNFLANLPIYWEIESKAIFEGGFFELTNGELKFCANKQVPEYFYLCFRTWLLRDTPLELTIKLVADVSKKDLEVVKLLLTSKFCFEYLGNDTYKWSAFEEDRSVEHENW